MSIIGSPMNGGAGSSGLPPRATGLRYVDDNAPPVEYCAQLAVTFDASTSTVGMYDVLTGGSILSGIIPVATSASSGVLGTAQWFVWSECPRKSPINQATGLTMPSAAGQALHYIYNVTASSQTMTLPNATSANTVKNLYTVKAGNFTVTMATISAQTVDGSAIANLSAYQSRTYQSDGANWYIVAGFG